MSRRRHDAEDRIPLCRTAQPKRSRAGLRCARLRTAPRRESSHGGAAFGVGGVSHCSAVRTQPWWRPLRRRWELRTLGGANPAMVAPPSASVGVSHRSATRTQPCGRRLRRRWGFALLRGANPAMWTAPSASVGFRTARRREPSHGGAAFGVGGGFAPLGDANPAMWTAPSASVGVSHRSAARIQPCGRCLRRRWGFCVSNRREHAVSAAAALRCRAAHRRVPPGAGRRCPRVVRPVPLTAPLNVTAPSVPVPVPPERARARDPTRPQPAAHSD